VQPGVVNLDITAAPVLRSFVTLGALAPASGVIATVAGNETRHVHPTNTWI
jgi:hypothetical protein